MTAEITRINTAAESKLIELFGAAKGGVYSGASLDREAAFARFAKSGLPHRRIEAWHYTDLRSILRDAYAPTVAPTEDTVALARTRLAEMHVEGTRVVILDGYFQAELSSNLEQPGVSTRSLIDVLGGGPSGVIDRLAVSALEAQESVLSLNAAFMQGGAVVSVAPGAVVETPIELLFLTSGQRAGAVTTRSLVEVGSGASAIVVERHEALGSAPSQSNHALILSVYDKASLHHVTMSSGAEAATQTVASIIANLGADANLVSFALVTGFGFVRRQGFLTFNGAHAKGDLRGISLLDHQGHADTTLVVTHKATHCESRELFKHILDDEATGVFQGKVIVAPGAQKTDGKMMSRAIFLADGATMYNKPELEIFADDVVCGHGATAGFLNEEQLFYLRARGIPEKEAQALLLEAFAAEAIEGVGTDAIREVLTESVGRWLRQRQD
ncbi:Fe-S cluster assembly protein SufD [Lichenifustis flavocetrariae]|uniref:Fe-S cluster assembly protein SufD n=1 Tax=Lichenifustis flavocetrariae TaxID=2949735 RepID=A0AA41YW95_9HYPH|nr:Fe-S cluster assembly protein SufD [Lichenifustis flavocetrariae]MCW6509741.1 Fe-S cluster assembly protein SufD [Lichenifustis flavocetrariae]